MGDHLGVLWFPSHGGEIKYFKDSLADGHLEADFHTSWHKSFSVRQEFLQAHGLGWEIWKPKQI